MALSGLRAPSRPALAFIISSGLLAGGAFAQTVAEDDVIDLDPIVVSAEEQVKQALGASTITEDELDKMPVTNDLSEIVRKMPGVNLTGNTTSGQRGNARQIDIRGMGPENTLILIDGKPVLSRNAVKMSRGGERDTRGDSNWIPPELVERVEVIRGPAAARYGSGASGGVVNIITKRPDTMTGQVGVHWTQPDDSREGVTKRTNFMLAGPVGEKLSFRVFGNYNDTEGDDPSLNPTIINSRGNEERLAGREGVVNKDLGSMLTWDVNDANALDFEFNFSRQGNQYAGDTRNGAVPTNDSATFIGEETNRMYRRNLAVTHRGDYGFGTSNSYLQWENTRNTRLCSGNAGSVEDNITPCVDTDGDGENDAFEFRTIELDNVNGKTEWNLPVDIAGRPSNLTLGAEYRGEFMDDPNSITNTLPDLIGGETGIDTDPANRPSAQEQHTIGLFAEANIEYDDRLTLTPALRFDWNDNFGTNWSPGLNATYGLTDTWSLKLGMARAFKTPNLFQQNPNYVYVTRGNGCPYVNGVRLTGPCYVLGNPDLEAEKSWNKEIGVAFEGYEGLNASLTYFRNDYDNRIGAGTAQQNAGEVVDPETGQIGNRLFRWENQKDAVIEGLEGSFATPLGERFAVDVNATKMITSEDGNGQPLSLVPDYTINAGLDFDYSDALTLRLAATHYGSIQPATTSATGLDYDDPNPRGGYTLFDASMVWDLRDDARISAGVTNLFDKSIERTDSGEGANTFNEPGRAFYISLNKTF